MASAASPEREPAAPAAGPLPATVVGLGLVSLLTDASSELVFPLLPAFLATLGASNAFIGLVEGTAELVANVLKYAAGLAADRVSRLKPLVLAGYGLSTVARPLVALATSPWHVLAVRAADRVGKGVRTSPRDALIAGVTDGSMRARAFGFHRAMDHAGAAIGTLLGVGLLWRAGGAAAATASALRTVFLWAALPGALAMVALAVTREPPRVAAPPRGAPAPVAPVPAALRRALLPIALFALANATDAFLLVKLARLGAPALLAPLLWLALHLVKAATATAGGRLADRYGRRNALAIGWTAYALGWGGVGLAASVPALFALTAAYGISHGLVEGAERALVAELAGGRGRGRAFGTYHGVVGLAALASSTGFGVVWDRFGDLAAFVGTGALALVAALALLALVPAALPPAPAP